jgi:hypothetical protein
MDIDTNKLEEYQERTSSSKPAEDFPNIEMSFSEDATQEEPHPEVRSPLV